MWQHPAMGVDCCDWQHLLMLLLLLLLLLLLFVQYHITGMLLSPFFDS